MAIPIFALYITRTAPLAMPGWAASATVLVSFASISATMWRGSAPCARRFFHVQRPTPPKSAHGVRFPLPQTNGDENEHGSRRREHRTRPPTGEGSDGAFGLAR